MFLDIDFKTKNRPTFLPQLFKLIHNTIVSFYGYLKNKELLKMYIISRLVNQEQDVHSWGFHVHFNITVDVPTMEIIRAVRNLCLSGLQVRILSGAASSSFLLLCAHYSYLR